MPPEKIGRYLIRKEIGRGGMSRVYLAYDPSFEREVAIKVLPREALEDVQFRTRFEREARFIAAVEHAAIVPVYDFGEQDGQPYLVMRFMQGGSLLDRLQRGPLSLAEAAAILGRITQALEHAHRRGIIHRDLKPGNILFDEAGETYLTDFGIAKRVMSTMTLTGNLILGTPAYMSPEQARGEPTVDYRTDIYALGAILFEMLTGRVPYEADTPTGQMLKHIIDPVPNILEVRKDLPAESQQVIERAMAKRAEARYPAASEFNQAVQELAHPKKATRQERSAHFTADQAITRKVFKRPWLRLAGLAGWVRARLWLVAFSLAGILLIAICVGLGSLLSQVVRVSLARATASATSTLPRPVASKAMLSPAGAGSVRLVGSQGGDLFRGLEEASPTRVSPGEAVPAGAGTRLWTREGRARVALGDGGQAILAENSAVWVEKVVGQDSQAVKTVLRLEKGALLMDSPAVVVQAYGDLFQVEAKEVVFGVAYTAQQGRFLVDCLAGTCVVSRLDQSGDVTIPAGQRGGFEARAKIELAEAQEGFWRELAGDAIAWPTRESAATPVASSTHTVTPTRTPTPTPSKPGPSPTTTLTPTRTTFVPSDTPKPAKPRPTATERPPTRVPPTPTRPPPSPTIPPPPTKQPSPTLPPPLW